MERAEITSKFVLVILNVITKAENLHSELLWEQCFSAFLSENRNILSGCGWLSSIKHISAEDHILRLEAPNELAKSWFENDFSAIFLKIAQRIDPNISQIEISVPKIEVSTPNLHSKSVHTPSAPPPISAPAPLRHSNFCKKYRLDNFIAGTSNEMALSAAKWICAQPRAQENFLVIKSGAGLGKTHLLHAIGRESTANWAKRAVLWDSDKFFKEWRNGNLSSLLQVDLFLFDNLQSLYTSNSAQEALLDILKSLKKNGRSIVVSVNTKSARNDGVLPELADFIKTGVKCELNLPNFHTRVAILKHKAGELGLPVDVLENEWALIARSKGESVCALEGALNELIAKQKLLKYEITPQFVRSLYGVSVGVNSKNGKEKILSPQEIMRIVAAAYQLPADSLFGKNRSAQVNKPRQIAMYMCRKVGLSLKEIGEHFNRDASSVASSISTLKRKIDGENGIALEMEIKELSNIR